MLPSKKLRNIISKKRKIKLDNFKWSKELEKDLFAISFIDGNKKMDLKTIYGDGFNIGNCLLTSYYVSLYFENSKICTGKAKLLVGTKNSKNGDHVWIENEDYIIDTTLMLMIPKVNELSFLYHKEYDLSYIKLPNDDISFQHDYYEMTNFPEEYFSNLYLIN